MVGTDCTFSFSPQLQFGNLYGYMVEGTAFAAGTAPRLDMFKLPSSGGASARTALPTINQPWQGPAVVGVFVDAPLKLAEQVSGQQLQIVGSDFTAAGTYRLFLLVDRPTGC